MSKSEPPRQVKTSFGCCFRDMGLYISNHIMVKGVKKMATACHF